MTADPLAPHTSSPVELKALLAAERTGSPFIAYRQAGRLQLVMLDALGGRATVGRRPPADIALTWDSEVSAVHAELDLLGGEWTVTDEGLSRNGTFVNGERVTGRCRLRDGDRMRVGKTLLAYNHAAGAHVAETLSATDQPQLAHLSDQQRRVLLALCRPYKHGDRYTTPATNQQIANELCLSVDAVKMHLRALFAKCEVQNLPQNQKRARLAESALEFGIVARRDL